MDPDNLPDGDLKTMNFGSSAAPKAWKEIWGCGQGIGAVDAVVPAAAFIAKLRREYDSARSRLGLASAAAARAAA